jgi:hypothetical protein
LDIGQQLFHGFGEGMYVSLWDQQAVATVNHQLWNSRDVRRDDWKACGHGFSQYVWDAVTIPVVDDLTRQDKHRGLTVQGS